MKKILPVIILYIFCLQSYADSTRNHSVITQRIVYHTAQAGEVYLVWGIDKWKEPKKKYWPENTYIKDNLAYSRMEEKSDSFSVAISLEPDSKMDFMFWISKTKNGKSADSWDSNWTMNYHAVFGEQEIIHVNDRALYLTVSGYNILQAGYTIAVVSGILVLFLFFITGRKWAFKTNDFIMGLWLAVLGMSMVIRVQMNGLFWQGWDGIPGTLFFDFLWLLLAGLSMYGLYFLTRHLHFLNRVICFFSIVVFLLTILFSLSNIEIVNQLGRPLNYQWIYYSDFMQGTDAKNAILKNLTGTMALNLALLLAASLMLGYAASQVLMQLNTLKKKALLWTPVSLLFLISIYQYKTYSYPRNTENPFLSLGMSLLTADRKAQLFSMPLSEESVQYIHDIHNIAETPQYDTNGLINNIVLFVLESTPQQYVNLYDSTFNVTPQLKKWKGASRIFTNVYAHIPSTPSSLFSLISGVYPLISYKSVTVENPGIGIPSLPGILVKSGWKSSLFFSSDLQYCRMDEYAANQQFETIKDVKSITCDRKKFRDTHSILDGLDDQCVTEEYFLWHDANKKVKKFSVLWTNQTHYPYFTREENPRYAPGNKDLNRYLSALKHGDEAFGMLMEGLKKRNELNNTLVIVIGDHGEAFGTHNQTSHAAKIYEENIRIPCILYNPILFHGTVDRQLGGIIDIPATICHLSGVETPEEWQGKSLLTDTNRDRTFFICPYSDFLFGTRTGKWKYIYNASTNKSELYDLATDPHELNNLAHKYPEKVKKEYEVIGAWIQYHTLMKLTERGH